MKAIVNSPRNNIRIKNLGNITERNLKYSHKKSLSYFPNSIHTTDKKSPTFKK